MKKFYPFLLILCCLLAFKSEDPKSLVKPGKFVLPKGVTSKDYLPNTLIIKFKKSSSKQLSALATPATTELKAKGSSLISLTQLFPNEGKTNAKQSFAVQPTPDLSDIYIARYQGTSSIEQVINTLLTDQQIEYAEPSYIYRSSYVPNDASLNLQTYFARIQAAQAWDIRKDASKVIIGIVDSGIDFSHEDLAGNIYVNAADPVNGKDDDGDGYVDNYYGWDFVGHSSASMIADNDPVVTSDSTDHGVHVAGIAGAISDNSKGVASIAFNAKLMIVKVGADNNSRVFYKGYEGIKYAVDHGASVINCSWGGPGGGQFGQEMIDYAVAKGSLVIAAAGNESTEDLSYPAAYKGVLAVGSVTTSDVKSGFSNYGYWVDLSAPGSSIYNTINRNRYGYKSGTSMSTPLVASAAALVKAAYPNYNGLQIGELLRMTADPIDGLNPTYASKMGSGRLNVYSALTKNPSSVRYQKIDVTDQSNGSRAPGTELKLALSLKSFLAPVSNLTVTVSSNSPYIQILNPTLSVGNLGTLEERDNLEAIRVNILPGAPQNHKVDFKLTYSGNGGAFSDWEFYTALVALDYLNVTVNKVSTTFSSNGRVGFSGADASNGLGFVYRDETLLYEATLLIGKSATQVSNNTRNAGNYNEDFAKLSSAAKVAGTKAAFEATSIFTDEKASAPIGVRVKSKMTAFVEAPDDKYVLVEYEISNTSAAKLQGIYTGMFVDWDLDESSKNATRFDTDSKLAYVYARSNADYPYAGVRLISNSSPVLYYPLSYQVSGDPLADNSFTIAEKFQTLSSGIKSTSLGTTGDGLDVMYVVGSGPYEIPANGSISVTYAFMAGDNLSDLTKTADAALTKFNSLKVVPTDPSTNPDGDKRTGLKQNFPNPASSATTIPFYLAEKGPVKITLSDVSGRMLETLKDEVLDPGNYHIQVNLSRFNPGIYFYTMVGQNYKKTLKMVVVR